MMRYVWYVGAVVIAAVAAQSIWHDAVSVDSTGAPLFDTWQPAQCGQCQQFVALRFSRGGYYCPQCHVFVTVSGRVARMQPDTDREDDGI